MARYKVVLAYDGTAFKGFQRQRDVRTVQGEVEAALKKIGWPGRTIYGAGRTDAGVHASGQVVAFDFDWQHGVQDLQNALNANLAEDVAARDVSEVREGFHPRYDALARRYEYRLLLDPIRRPLQDRYAWRLWPPPDAGILDRAAALFIGVHDFAAFGTPPREGGSTTREVFASAWEFGGEEAVYTIEANAFLFHMVRRIVRAQLDAAQGKTTIQDTAQLLLEEGLRQAGPAALQQGLAPARGLTMVAVRYPTDDG